MGAQPILKPTGNRNCVINRKLGWNLIVCEVVSKYLSHVQKLQQKKYLKISEYLTRPYELETKQELN